MGNTVSGATARTGGALDSYVSELGADIIYEKRHARHLPNIVDEILTRRPRPVAWALQDS